MSICVKLSNNGFFTNFNQVVDWLAFGNTYEIPVGVDWHMNAAQEVWDFNYGIPGDGNIWNSFFLPLPCPANPDLVVTRVWTEVLSGFRGYALYNGLADFERIRNCLHDSFRRHVHLVPDIAARIERFAHQNFSDRAVIGVHLRNPRGSRGIYGYIPPLESYLRHIDQVVSTLPNGNDWRIFAASDTDALIDELNGHYPGRIVSQEGITRASVGSSAEIHISEAPCRTLGVEVISDCWLLARCAHLVGVQSAVCTAALFINPHLQFSNVQTPARIAAGRVEYELKKVYCGLFESIHPQVLQARELAVRGAAS